MLATFGENGGTFIAAWVLLPMSLRHGGGSCLDVITVFIVMVATAAVLRAAATAVFLTAIGPVVVLEPVILLFVAARLSFLVFSPVVVLPLLLGAGLVFLAAALRIV